MTTVTESLARRIGEGTDMDDGIAPAIRQLVNRLHDACWSSPRARARGMRHLILAARDSVGGVNEGEFANRVTRLAIQLCVPTALRAAAQCCASARRRHLLYAAELCESAPTRNNVLGARTVASYAAIAAAKADAADADATYAAAASAYAAANAAASADASADAGSASADAAYADAARGAAAYSAAASADAAASAYAAACAVSDGATAARCAADMHLSDFAEGVVQILRDLRARSVRRT